jgi:hypothetical protein
MDWALSCLPCNRQSGYHCRHLKETDYSLLNGVLSIFETSVSLAQIILVEAEKKWCILVTSKWRPYDLHTVAYRVNFCSDLHHPMSAFRVRLTTFGFRGQIYSVPMHIVICKDVLSRDGWIGWKKWLYVYDFLWLCLGFHLTYGYNLKSWCRRLCCLLHSMENTCGLLAYRLNLKAISELGIRLGLAVFLKTAGSW